MNYRERLETIKGQAIKAITASSCLIEGGGEILSKVIGTDKRLMRRLASAYAKDLYKNDIWLTKLKQSSEQPDTNWLIKFDERGKIVVEDNKKYIGELLTLLEEKRVKTLDGIEYDVDGELISLPAAG
ncbi:DUF4868 domain-containing protein [Sansalvadorimonas sp. 2012CJ34-2]|uniref:DUF4868 domain-containing protein n=1 Tax=Parendozoicomonas callyspongiae TaxID=2942213 RepID=A0ABT0PLD5_9GAMM|nr:Kiwa anti-phage protein KwaB-like domain-containing protein [Sansalvadorimonas sp. 2012CJ34-2]MCL6272200.1 DUF4868 domain-containing protein [Sansalvadorimonas sp. 2012CJ34-2]